MSHLVVYADILAGLFGLAGSFVLGFPLIGELRDRRHWQRMASAFRRKPRKADPSPTEAAPDLTELRLRLQALDRRLGGFERTRLMAFFGYFLMLLAFGFLIVAGFTRT